MKALFSILLAVCFLGCDVNKTSQAQSEEARGTSSSDGAGATPAPARVAAPKATPKPGDWMWKKYENPLEKK